MSAEEKKSQIEVERVQFNSMQGNPTGCWWLLPVVHLMSLGLKLSYAFHFDKVQIDTNLMKFKFKPGKQLLYCIVQIATFS